MRRTLQRQFQNQELLLLGSVSHNVICSTDLSRKPERYQRLASVLLQPSFITWAFAARFRAILVQCKSGAATGAFISTCTVLISIAAVLRRRRLWNSSQENRLRTGCNDDRSLPVGFSLGLGFESTKRRPSCPLLDLRGSIPTSNNHYRTAETHEGTSSIRSSGEAGGAIYLMDRGYLDFSRLYNIHQSGAFSHHRAKKTIAQTASFNAGRQE